MVVFSPKTIYCSTEEQCHYFLTNSDIGLHLQETKNISSSIHQKYLVCSVENLSQLKCHLVGEHVYRDLAGVGGDIGLNKHSGGLVTWCPYIYFVSTAASPQHLQLKSKKIKKNLFFVHISVAHVSILFYVSPQLCQNF